MNFIFNEAKRASSAVAPPGKRATSLMPASPTPRHLSSEGMPCRPLHPQSDHAKQANPAQRENAYDVQILRDNDSIMFTCVIEDRGIRGAYNRCPAGGWR